MSDTSHTHQRHSAWMLAYLILTALLCGALIMVIEVLGSRVIGPFFGVSLFVWTSLIAIAMIALALGYAIGGWIADRYGRPETLYGIIFVAGLTVLMIPFYKLAVLQLCVPLGLRLGAFISATLLFGPSLFLLGCVSPLLIKIAAREMTNLGRTVGGFYAISTVGSVVGTSLAGFVLIGYMGVNSIFHLVGVLLCLLGTSYFLIARRWWAVVPAGLVLLIPQQHAGQMPTLTAADGTQVQLVADNDSHYGNLKVVDYRYGDQHIREMMIDGLIQGGVDMRDGRSIYAYPYFLTLLPEALKTDIDRALVIGMGAGIVPNWLEQRGVTTDVVDIDPAVFDFSSRYFGVQVSGQEIVQDARYFLQNSDKQYDLVVLDVFNGDTTPGHLLSLEALQLVEQRLTVGGVLSVNLVGDLQRNTYMTASVVKTFEQVFDQVVLYPTVKLGEQGGNLALLAYQGHAKTPDLSLINAGQINRFARSEVMTYIRQPFRFAEGTPAIVLTDDYNPIDVFDASLREGVRQGILRDTQWDILGYSG